MILPFLRPQWPAPHNIVAYTTLRYPGNSIYPYAAFNMALHVGDDPRDVMANRHRLSHVANLPAAPKWLEQTHSDIVLLAETISSDSTPIADASYTQQENTVCVVMTADCLPILVTNKEGTEVAAIHAGWQGLAKGIVENTLAKMLSQPESLLIWIGPSIQQAHYEVGEDFYKTFAEQYSPAEMQAAFINRNKHPKKWLANMRLLAVQRLRHCGVVEQNIYLSQECTYANAEKYFSYRRDGITGRIASMIYISDLTIISTTP